MLASLLRTIALFMIDREELFVSIFTARTRVAEIIKDGRPDPTRPFSLNFSCTRLRFLLN